MTTPFRPVNFGTESLTSDKLQQLANNTQYLFDNASKVRYKLGALERESGVKILTGKATLPPQTDRNYGRVDVYFGNFFTSGCRPIVVAGVESGMVRVQVSIKGHGDGSIDHTGFRGYVSSDYYKTLDQSTVVAWIAVGF